MDDLSFALAIELQLRDVEDALSSRKGKGRLGDAVTSSDEVAFDDYRQHLLAAVNLLADERLAESLDRAVRSDGELLEELRRLELGDEGSHKLAMELSEEPVVVSPEVKSRNEMWKGLAMGTGQEMTDEAIEELERRCREWDLIDEMGQKSTAGPSRSTAGNSGSSKSAANTVKPYPLKPQKANCAICLESFPAQNTIAAPCSHTYCFDDLKDLFMRSCKDEQLFPPRCCKKELSLELVLPLFNDNEATEFLEKSEEYGTKDRTYCYQPSCSRFIPPQYITRDVGTCTMCYMRTCTLCKKEEHDEEECPDDPSMKLTLEVAAANGWQRCQQCHSLLEKTYGCQHMTCRCKAEWCYRCGLKWKTCECDDWDAGHLQRRAEDLAIRDMGRNAAPREIAVRVGAIVEDLRAGQECDHTGGWTYQKTGATCELCAEFMPRYILMCNGCRLVACNRCHINRI